MEVQFDYRNAKYQGEVAATGSRNGFGILVDDDLSFYASHWKDNRLNDSTVIYISHGKYIYGQWAHNEPNGLNVFRIGDTVVVGEFQNGEPIKNIIIIFQKCNYVSILRESPHKQDWEVIESGILKNYDDLLRYINDAEIPMKPQYFSLSKFLTFISNARVSAVPCRGSENCYFGYGKGLGIVFNANNGVVSVGCHEGKKVVEFGGKYEIPAFAIEGNFETNQIVKYSKERPKNQIYSIFQKMHKRSLNFKNQYFDSKVKLLTSIETLVRSKIDEIVNKKHENTFTAVDLNDSLDYHPEDQDQINRINQIREEVYESVHIPMKKVTSKYVEASPVINKSRSSILTPRKSTSNQSPSPVAMKKSPKKIPERHISRSRTPTKMSKNTSKSHLADSQESCNTYNRESAEDSPQVAEVPLSTQKWQPSKRSSIKPTYLKEEEQIRSPVELMKSASNTSYRKLAKAEEPPAFQTFYEEEENTAARFREDRRQTKYGQSEEELFAKVEKRMERPVERSPIKGPNYEDLSERRKRILKQFKKLNGSQIAENIPKTPKAPEPVLKARNSINSSSSSSQKQDYTYGRYMMDPAGPELESPLARQKMFSYESKNTEQNSQMMPLSIRKQNMLYSHSALSQEEKKDTGTFVFNYETPVRPIHKQNSDIMGVKPFEKKESQKEESEWSKTPTKKKAYKYYFE